MAKKIVQDVVPPERRSIRNIPLPQSKFESKEEIAVPQKRNVREVSPVAVEEPDFEQPSNRRSIPRWSIWTVATLCILILIYAVSFFFVSAKVTIKPKHQTLPLNLSVSLPYDTISLDQEGSKQVAAQGEETVSLKAEGTVFIFNDYSKTPQTLVKNTRLETPSGLIFRIQNEVVVPGKITKAGVSTPGSVKVSIVAEEAGEKYNVGLSDFTIPGFKGSLRYRGFYARSEGAIKGGFVGNRKKINQSDLDSAKAEIETKLKSDLLAAAGAQVPKGSIVYPDLATFTFTELPQGDAPANAAIIREKGTIKAVIVDSVFLSDSILKSSLPAATGVIDIVNLKELSVVKKSVDATVSFTISGNPIFVWSFDAVKLKSELASKSKSDLKSVLSKYPAIESAKAVISPFWIGTFPKDPSKTTIILSPID